MNPPAGIILAGGRSQRMGTNKALLPFPGNASETFLAHMASTVAPLCAEVLIVARDPAQFADVALPGTRIVFDQKPGGGPLMGLYSGLNSMQSTTGLVVAVDMPFVQPALLTFLLDCYQQDTLVVPVVDGVPQVLLALYPRSIIPLIESLLQQEKRAPRALLEVAPVHYIEEARLREVDPQLRSFVGINTQEDLDAAMGG
ncbi:MAG TPA: molybdenum cofactor guanylyltransferase [Ktedonobacteraceae bacterium]|nr:molybdenum cofactor guanylyltransferase [Ktedonobacteraceae bacterium]